MCLLVPVSQLVAYLVSLELSDSLIGLLQCVSDEGLIGLLQCVCVCVCVCV